MDIKEIVVLATQAQELRPVVQLAVDEFKAFYVPLLKEAGDYVFAEGAEARIKYFKHFREELGLDNDQALQLTINLFDMLKPRGAK